MVPNFTILESIFETKFQGFFLCPNKLQMDLSYKIERDFNYLLNIFGPIHFLRDSHYKTEGDFSILNVFILNGVYVKLKANSKFLIFLCPGSFIHTGISFTKILSGKRTHEVRELCWVGGWVVIIYPLRFPLFLGM